MKSHSFLPLGALVALIAQGVQSKPIFISRIPNGDNVLGPDGMPWANLGHQAQNKASPLNPFGLDFKANGLNWTVALCLTDSDGDGRTNGEELGDPACIWSVGMTPTFQDNITHPGLFNAEFAETDNLLNGTGNDDPSAVTGGATQAADSPKLQLYTWVKWHIACMWMSWGFLLPIGALMAISFRGSFSNKARWFQIHVVIQIMGVLFNIAGFVIPFVNISVHFKDVHQILGTVVFALGLAQAAQGFIRPGKPEKGQQATLARRIWEICHKGFGRIVIVLAWINIFLGIKLVKNFFAEADGNQRVMAAMNGLLGIQAVICVVLTVVSVFYRSRPSVEEKEEEESDEMNDATQAFSLDGTRHQPPSLEEDA